VALARLVPAVAAVQGLAGARDAVESTALLLVVGRRADAERSVLARRAARTKFFALGVGWLYTCRC